MESSISCPSILASPRQSASAGSSADYTTWTLADVKNALSKLPEGAMVFNQYYTQSEMLMYCVAMNAKGFMDWQNGTCNFDSDEFRALLEFVKPLPAEFSWQSDGEYESDFTRMKSGKQLLYPMNLNDFDNIYYTFAALDHDIRFVGFPREDGSSGQRLYCQRNALHHHGLQG